MVVSTPCVVAPVEAVEVDGEEAVVVSDEVVVVSVDGVFAVVELCWLAESVALVYESPDEVEVETTAPIPAAFRLRRALFCRNTNFVSGGGGLR
ncbi:hypothetical protein PR003_g3202 [Phytophthora rubi]|uniref:Uncharacterized protein n=1 Tax=Phytophthora rubi TaxID=129364 RepID=A0A6A4G032_9STRA|nr:hypothetical protein PR002_g3111 [Phytophthora rubi]KAE9354742.1 hypothetical protein PR003_g3202 [Phytophthora rubi]